MVDIRMGLRIVAALPLLGDHMQQNRHAKGFRQADCTLQLLQIVAVDGAEIVQPEGGEHIARKELLFQLFLHPVAETVNVGINPHQVAVFLFQAGIAFTQAHPAEDARHPAHIAVDGHGIIVEDDDDGLKAGGHVFNALVGKASGQGAISDYGTDVIVLMQQRPGLRHPQRDRDRV